MRELSTLVCSSSKHEWTVASSGPLLPQTSTKSLAVSPSLQTDVRFGSGSNRAQVNTNTCPSLT